MDPYVKEVISFEAKRLMRLAAEKRETISELEEAIEEKKKKLNEVEGKLKVLKQYE
jgi:hypothetical protein